MAARISCQMPTVRTLWVGTIWLMMAELMMLLGKLMKSYRKKAELVPRILSQ